MKKLFSFFSIIFLVSLVFVGCQTSEDLTSPVSEELEKRGGHNNACSLIPINNNGGEEACVELVAARNKVIGNVCTQKIGTSLKVTYNITKPGWTITKTHLAVVGNKNNFPTKWNGKPKLNQFPYIDDHNNVTTVEYLVPINSLPNKIYIAAHATVVKSNTQLNNPIWPDLSEYDQYTMIGPIQENGNHYYFDERITLLGDSNKVFSGWCADQDRYVPYQMQPTDVKFLLSVEDNPEFNCFIETLDYRPQLNKLNDLINSFPLGTEVFDANNNSLGVAYMQEIQTTIWKLIDEDPIEPNNPEWNPNINVVNRILELLNSNFVPTIGQKVAVFALEDIDYCSTPNWEAPQPIIIELEVESIPGNCVVKNAWGFPYNNCPLPFKSAKFGHSWARYFSYLK